jgi:hypothetical protein
MRRPARTTKEKTISAVSGVVSAADCRNHPDSQRFLEDPPILGEPDPPRPLGTHGRALWDRIQAEYGIRDSAGVEMLAQACAAVDRAEALSAAVAKVGFMVGGRANGLIKDELAARSFVTRTLSRLGLDLEPAKPVGRPLHGGLGVRRGAA